MRGHSHTMDANDHWYGLVHPPRRQTMEQPRVLIVGAGSRGNAYAKAITAATSGIIVAVVEPIAHKRERLGRKYIWQDSAAQPNQQFHDWRDFVACERARRDRANAGVVDADPPIDTACICTLDTQHLEIILALVPLGLHILSEKPLATTLQDCLAIYRCLSAPELPGKQAKVFGVGHVLRYSPHNMLLRKLLLQEKVIGDVLSIEHTEPVGWWHFAHSYVRGNWRREDTTAPSLLTKSCHDIDLILWLLCSPADPESNESPHLPSVVSSTGHLGFFKKSRKPKDASVATNCLRCPMERDCNYSAKKIYVEERLRKGQTDWPVSIVEPEIEDVYQAQGAQSAEKILLQRLGENYDARKASPGYIRSRNWFGRCVWESDNDVCDDQTVSIAWEEDPANPVARPAKTATFHQIAHTDAQCARRGRVYGSHGELTYDSKTIRVSNFGNVTPREYHPTQTDFNDPIAKHGGGDTGLAQQFIAAVSAVKNGDMDAGQAQKRYLGCTIEDAFRSHALVFAAEQARTSKTVIDWASWWQENVEKHITAPEKRPSNGNGDWQMVDSTGSKA